ncbi:MAG: four helix bundle protein [Candidatus Omnitrophica bacterium]|nr:four helix bundle protein [Candidatus Omnitrophota bacterium]
MEKAYKKLLVWKKADEFAYQIYLKTKSFPKEEIYGITSQLRRASLSVPANIVEGCGRQGQKELKNFINIALGSLMEAEYYLEFCRKLGYLKEDEFKDLEKCREGVGGLLWRFYKSL